MQPRRGERRVSESKVTKQRRYNKAVKTLFFKATWARYHLAELIEKQELSLMDENGEINHEYHAVVGLQEALDKLHDFVYPKR